MKAAVTVILIFKFLTGLAQVSPDFDLQGHRGARGNFPENSIAAMLFAIDSGVNTLEMDVVVTGDMRLILSHEPFMNHEICQSFDGETIALKNEMDYNIYMMSYEKVLRFECGTKGNPRFPQQIKLAQQKPRLDDLLNQVYYFCDSLNLPLPALNIEIKSRPKWDNIYHPEPEKYATLLVEELKKMQYPAEKVTIQSFDPRPLKFLHKNYTEYKLAFLVEDKRDDFKKQLKKLGFTPDIYSPYFMLISKDQIDQLHEKKIQVIPWTVNDTEDAEKLIKMGVDGLITDYPAVMRKFIDQL